MADLPSMPLYVDDFEAATAHLTLEEDGVYNRLLRLCWRTPGCSIPDDAAWIARRLRVDAETFERLVAPLIAEFFQRKSGRIFQKRQREIFATVSDLVLKKKSAGKKGGLAKAMKTREKTSGRTTDVPVAKAKHCSSNQNQNQNQRKEPPKSPRGDPDPPQKKPPEKRPPRSPPNLPVFIRADVAKGFIDHRRAKRKPLTERAYLLLSREFERIRQAGHDPNDALDLAIERGWDTVKLDWLVNARQRAGPDRDEFDEKYGADGIAGIMREAARRG